MNEDIRLLHGDCLELHKGYYDQAVERVRGALAQKELPL